MSCIDLQQLLDELNYAEGRQVYARAAIRKAEQELDEANNLWLKANKAYTEELIRSQIAEEKP